MKGARLSAMKEPKYCSNCGKSCSRERSIVRHAVRKSRFKKKDRHLMGR